MSQQVESKCPKCEGRMVQGYLIDNARTSVSVTTWVQGAPQKSSWLGSGLTFAAELPYYPVGAYRCRSCGFLEFYAGDEFAAA